MALILQSGAIKLLQKMRVQRDDVNKRASVKSQINENVVENVILAFVSFIHLRNVTVPLLHTDLMFSSASHMLHLRHDLFANPGHTIPEKTLPDNGQSNPKCQSKPHPLTTMQANVCTKSKVLFAEWAYSFFWQK